MTVRGGYKGGKSDAMTTGERTGIWKRRRNGAGRMARGQNGSRYLFIILYQLWEGLDERQHKAERL